MCSVFALVGFNDERRWFNMREFKNLDVWNRAIKIAKKIYEVVDEFPKKEDWALSSQMRRAVVSISSNIAEGCGRRTDKDTVQFLYIAMGSLREVESQMYIAKEFGYVSENVLKEVSEELVGIGKQLYGLINYISKKQ